MDAVVSPQELLKTARQWALDIVEVRRPWVKTLYRNDKIESLSDAREILKFARMQTKKQAANLSHPLVCIDVIEEGIVSGPRAGLQKVNFLSVFLFSILLNIVSSFLLTVGLWQEAKSFQKLLFSDTCKSLVNVFFAQRSSSKVWIIFFIFP